MVLLLIASCCVGLVTYFLTEPLVRDILDRNLIERDAWNRQEGRWQRLRRSSQWLYIAEPWIRSGARLVQRRTPWITVQGRSDDIIHRLFNLCVNTIFGSPQRLALATQMRSHDYPWSVDELAAAAGLLSLISATMAAVCLPLRHLSLSMFAITELIVAIIVYRIVLRSFIRRAEDRRVAVRQLLPHAIDAIAMIMSSGGTFEHGIDSIVADFPNHPLSKELSRLHNSHELGQTMREAIEDSAHAVCLPEFDEFARVLSRIHGDGVPAAENFQHLAKHLRVAHLRRMEEEVGKAEASMSLPTMCVLGASMLVCVTPFVLSLWESDLFK